MALPATGLGGLAVTGLGLLRQVRLREALGAGVAVAVAAVPEGLPLVSTVAQLSAARRLSRRGMLVRSPARWRHSAGWTCSASTRRGP
ncbi:MAG TPA: hypothetical protein VGH53_06220 [Streptosporangiaceae bacterium]|jgi:cation-transporting ATPase I